jgi:hypothetical protein
MKNVILSLSCALTLMAAPLAAQTGSGSGSGSGTGRGDQAAVSTTQSKPGAAATATKVEEAPPNPRFVRTLTNVQIELTLSDQAGTAPPDKKTVSMVVSSGNWGKIRSAANVIPIGELPYVVDLNVDARPFVSTEGQIQLEMTLVYAPIKGPADPKDPKQRPAGVNQSQTVVLQSGKPLIISQAADPTGDRKIVVEVKATVLK